MATMSASTGGRTTPSETASAIDTISSAPLACAICGDGRNVFNDAEEVRALNQNGRGLFGDRGVQRFKIDAAGLAS